MFLDCYSMIMNIEALFFRGFFFVLHIKEILKLVNNVINLNTVFFVLLCELLISGAFKLSTHIPPLGRGRSGYVTRKLPSSPVHRRFYAPEI